MEATGRDGIRTGSSSSGVSTVSSSRSGTIVSAAYTSSACGSCLSSLSLDLATHFVDLEIHEDTEIVQHINKFHRQTEDGRSRMDDIRSLVQEFFAAAPSDMGVLERWFTELGVAWVLHLPDGDGASAGKLEHASAAASWMCGLSRILETIRSTVLFLSISGSLGQVAVVSDRMLFALFIKEVMSKMLPFVDIAILQVVVSNNEMPLAPYKKLHTLLAVYKALSDAAGEISFLFRSQFPIEIEGCEGVMVRLLSAKQGEAGKAIWRTMEHIRTRALESIDTEYDDDASSSLTPQTSSDIDKATLSVLEYINFICSNCSSMGQIVSKAVSLGKYAPQFVERHPLENMIMDIKSCLQEKLVRMSESFPNQGLRILFLLNNLEFIRQSLLDSNFGYCFSYYGEAEDLAKKVEGYMDSYLQECWAPVLSCLFSSTPLCFGTNHSPLLKFEFEFKKTYITQKLWKVPDPKLRRRLRTAITKKIVPVYIEYLEENNVIAPGLSPQHIEMILQELFEG